MRLRERKSTAGRPATCSLADHVLCFHAQAHVLGEEELVAPIATVKCMSAETSAVLD